MSDPLDTLRNDLTKLMSGSFYVSANVIKLSMDAEAWAEKIIEFLAAASGEQRRAVLGLLGYEVTEVTTGHVYISERSGTYAFVDGPALVLRDQRETT